MGRIEIREPSGEGEVLVGRDDAGGWMVTWLPFDRSHPEWPGFTIHEASGQLPSGGAEAIFQWAKQQDWGERPHELET